MHPLSLDNFLHQLLYDPKNPLLFNNGFFIYFFTIFICLYYAFRNLNNGRSILVSLFSLYFFYKASGYFVGLVIFSAVADYLLSNLIYRLNSRIKKKAVLAVSIIFNLGILFYFKYTNFFIALSNDFFSTHVSPINILLPIGISFYTFENLSYTIDVYRGEFIPEKKFFNYLLFLSFFPKLVMGPIVRAKDFIPQLYKPYYVSRQDFERGFYLIFSGLFKKMIIADYLSLNIVNPTFDNPVLYPGMQCVVAVLAYALVIYCDFSGYSDVAIGIARWMGISIPPNFLSPYRSRSITEFWHRWHISLSSWLRDYLYIFWLGGSRKGKIRTYFNLAVTMLLGGLWHGAKWTFIVWGGLHAAGLIFHKLWIWATGRALGSVNNKPWYNLFSGLFTFLFVCFCWIFFKSADFQTASQMLTQITTNFSINLWPQFWASYYSVILFMILGYGLHMVPEPISYRISEIFLEKSPMITYVLFFVVFIVVYAYFKSATPIMPIYLQF